MTVGLTSMDGPQHHGRAAQTFYSFMCFEKMLPQEWRRRVDLAVSGPLSHIASNKTFANSPDMSLHSRGQRYAVSSQPDLKCSFEQKYNTSSQKKKNTLNVNFSHIFICYQSLESQRFFTDTNHKKVNYSVFLLTGACYGCSRKH